MGCGKLKKKRITTSLGFSVIELMVTVAVLSTVLVFIIACFTSLMESTQKGSSLTVAVYLAESQIEQLKANPQYLYQALQSAIYGAGYSNGAAAATGKSLYSVMGNTQSSISNVGGSKYLNQVVYYYWITAQKFNANTNPLQNLYMVDAEVFWYGTPDQRKKGKAPVKAGEGALHTHLSRAFYLHG